MSKGMTTTVIPQIADKEGKNVVFPSLWLAGENQ